MPFPHSYCWGELYRKSKGGSATSSPHCSNLVKSDVGPPTTGEPDQSTLSCPLICASNYQQSRRATSSDHTRSPSTGRLASLRIDWRRRNFQSKLVTASWGPGTEKSYSSGWKRWDSWCSTRQIDPFPTTITPVIEFPNSEFQGGKL